MEDLLFSRRKKESNRILLGFLNSFTYLKIITPYFIKNNNLLTTNIIHPRSENMSVDYFESLLKKNSIFEDESKLDIGYIPETLPHREKEISLLSRLFLVLITNPNSISRKILITGKTGIGKTVTVKFFGKLLMDAAIKRDITIKYVHVNCRKERTSYKVLIKIIRSMNSTFPKRGYSTQDLLEIIVDALNDGDSHLLVALDEMNYLINKRDDLIYSLTRLNDDSIGTQQRISIIGIVRDLSCLNNLDTSTLSTLQRNIIKFQNYNTNQIFEILKYRVIISLKRNSISDDLIRSVSERVFKNGDLRYGLNILWRAGKIAEFKNLKLITPECIRLGIQDLVPFSTEDVLKYISNQKLVFLFSIVKTLQIHEINRTSISSVTDLYHSLCESLAITPRLYSQLWNYLQEFKREGLIAVEVVSSAMRGRKIFIEIPGLSLQKLQKVIQELLKERDIKI